MDKEAFLHQLESAVTKNDKKVFIETIFDLPPDVVVGITEEEFSRVISLSRLVSLQQVDELFNFLEDEGLFFLQKVLEGNDELNNSLIGRFYYSLFISLAGNNKQRAKSALINNAVACCKLAEIGVDSKENLETAIRLYRDAQEIFPKKSADYALALMNEGPARKTLAEIGVDSKENLEIAIRLYRDAQEILPKTSADYAGVLMNEGNARLRLAEMGVDSKENFETAVRLYRDAQEIFPKKSPSYARALGNEGNVRQRLAGMGIDSKENLETAVRLYRDTHEIFLKTSADYARALMSEGSARSMLAGMGIDSKENLEIAVRLYSDAQEIFPKTSADYAGVLMNEGNARKTLAEMGIDSKENLEIAIRLYSDAQEMLSKTSADYALTLMNEGNARKTLAEMGIDSKENLEIAVRLYSDAQEILSKTSADYARALMNEGTARSILAKIGIDSKENLETAIRLYRDAQEIFPKKSTSYARALMNEGSARSMLAGMGIDSEENLETAVKLYRNAQEILSKTSVDYAGALMNEGSIRSMLAEMGINSNNNFENSKKLYLKSISILEELRDGWSYSLALLNFNSLLKDNFYKTGDKKHLEEWEKNLGDIEEKIKGRDIRYNEIVVARVHEMRASLLEFDGKQGISDASFEYYEAYKLSQEPYYKFMKEFCQARSDNKSFCKIVSDWKEGEKKGIFLDYYDYTVFECHLENALKKSIFRKDEIELARQKLEEIGSRTQIKIVKDRVSAYVLLMNSIDFCFEQGSYEDAAENVRKACKIFHEFDDKPGCEMCECFHEALLENKNPESWRSVVQKILLSGEFSSNFYRLLCNYSDKKRTSILQDLPLQIFAKTSRIEEKVDNIQKTLDLISADCISIKDQIEEGFEGTAAELRQIKGKIDNIEQDLDNLVRISNDVDGKEGRCIREFASKMLELMKKGDAEALKRFSEKIVQNSSSITEIIEASNIPEKEKSEAKSKLADIKKRMGVLKEKSKSFSVGVTENVIANLISGEIVDGEAIKIVSLASGEIIKLLIPVLSTAAFGVPVPSKVVEMLLEAMKNS
jgi:tetratricopeptide (TPR) repeat protein